MSNKILFVDDDPNLLAAFQRNLRKLFQFDCAGGGLEAIDLVKKLGPYAVVVCDMRMPGMDGVKTLEHIRALAPDTVRIMLTGNAEQQTAVDAVNRGQIFRFLNKPCPPDVLVPALETALKQAELVRTERELLEGTLMGSVKAFGDLLAMVAPEAHNRCRNLREHIEPFAVAAGAGPMWELEISAMLALVGFASIPPSVQRKTALRTGLSLDEERMVRRVPQIGHDLLVGIPRLDGVAKTILYQQKHFDGLGYPGDFCSGNDIPVGARMLKILLDRIDLEVDGIVRNHALDTMGKRSGAYDTRLLELCFECLPGSLIKSGTGERPPLALSIAELAAGQLLARDIVTPSGLVLIGSGNRLTPMTVERIRNLSDLGEVSEPFMVVDEPALPKPVADA